MWLTRLFIITLFTLSYSFSQIDVYTVDHVVKPGEWLSTISASQNTSWETVYHINKTTIGTNPNLLNPGDTLKIPIGYTLNELPNYTWEFRGLLFILFLFWIVFVLHYNKEKTFITAPSVVNSGITSVQSTIDAQEKVISEVPIEMKPQMNFELDKVKSEVQSEKVKSDVDQKDLSKKLKELKKKR